MKKVLFALLLVMLLVSCKTADPEVIYMYEPIDLSEPNAILFDARPQTDFLVGDVTTYEGLYEFAREGVEAYREWRGYAINLETYLKALEEELKN